MSANNKGQNVANAPLLRFPEFDEEWILLSLENITQRVTRKNKNNESDVPLTISAQYGMVDQRDFFNKIVASANLTTYYLLKKGEFAYNKSYSSGYPWGAIKRLDKYEKGVLSSLYICFEPKSNVNSDFLVQYFESSKWHESVSNIAGEGARNHGLLNVSVTDFFKTCHYIPDNLTEQKKIAEFLSLLDKRIEIQRTAIEKLKSLMAGICSKILLENTPNTRIKDCLSCESSTLKESDLKDQGLYPVYGANGLCGFTDSAECNNESILIVKDGSGVGSLQYVTGDYSFIGTLNCLKLKNGFCLKYIYFMLSAFDFSKFKTGMAIPHIYFKDYGNSMIYCPPFDKQKKIAEKISNLETKIKRESNLLSLYQNQKQYLLSKMFI